MIAEELKLIIRAEVNNAIANLKQFSNTAGDARMQTSRLQDRLSNFGKSLLAAGGAIFGIRALVNLLKSSVAEFQQQEEAEAKLATAIRATGKESLISVQSIGRLANELQRTTTFADEATISAAAMLQQLANLDDQGLKEIIPRVQNFAAAMGIDLVSAATLVGKTLGTSTNALSRYIGEVDLSGSKSEKTGKLIKALDDKFRGMAEALGQTTSGKIIIFKNQMNELKEALGKEIVPLLTRVTGGITSLINEINKETGLTRALSTKGLAEAISSYDRAIETIAILQAGIDDIRKTFPDPAKSTLEKIARFQKQIDMIRQVLPLLELQRQETEKNAEANRRAAEHAATLDASLKELKTSYRYLGNDIKNAATASMEYGRTQKYTNDRIMETWGKNPKAFLDPIAKAIAAHKAFKDSSEEVAKVLEERQNKAIEEAKKKLEEYQKAARAAVTAIAPFADAIGMMARDSAKGWEMFADAAKDAVARVLEILAQEAFTNAAIQWAKVFSGNVTAIPGALAWSAAGTAALVAAGVVKALGEGGIVTGPTQALIGERGPEAVIPLDKMSGIGTRVIVHVYGSVMEEEGLARKIGYIVSRQRRGY